MDINAVILAISNVVWGWPLILFILGITVYTTVALSFIQFRYFFDSWKMIFTSSSKDTGGDMTPFEAFINALSTSIGNGSIAGMATAIYAGGPGAAFWIFVFGLLSMSLRYSEVFLSMYFTPITKEGHLIGGPMIYLERLPWGRILAYGYAVFLFFLSLTSGSAMQANSIRIAFARTWGISPWIIAIFLLLFIAYVLAGGAKRIIEVSDRIVPIKVGLFFLTAIILLAYHFQALLPALKLIVMSAVAPGAIAGGATGFLIQQALRFGIVRSVNATEAGFGTAAVLFGGTSSKEPVRNGIMSMASVFISANLVCFIIAWIIVASGVWNSGQTSLDLTISAYETVFGSFGGWVVTFLSVSFGIGVLVTFSYIARACWLYMTGGRLEFIYKIIFCLVTFLGALTHVDVVWNSIDLVNAGLLVTNLTGIAVLLPTIRKSLQEYMKKNEKKR